MNHKLAALLLARLFGLLAFVMGAICVPWSWYEGDIAGARALGAGAVIAAALTATLWWIGRHADRTLRIRDALVVVTLGWFGAGLLGALPYFLSGAIPRFHDAYFESVSGFTTTGSTILTNIEALSQGMHLWRMLTHWLGGIGIVVIFVALFPQLGAGAKHLFRSEVAGPITEGLRPKIKQTALVLSVIYVGLTVIETVLLAEVGGMNYFEAVLNSMSNIGTAGFSTRNASIGGFESATIEWIVIVFMYLAGVNFALYFAALSGRLGTPFKNFEWRVYTAIVLFTTIVMTVWLYPLYPDLHDTVRNALFQVLAICTTTGFSTADYELWPAGCQVLLVMLMIAGGSAGSTAGGMKISRVIIMAKAAFNEVRHEVHPHAVSAVKLGRSPIGHDVIRQTFGFAFLWVATALIGSFLVALTGVDFFTALAAGLTCTANVGPGFGEVGPAENFASIPAAGKYVLTVCMVLGRLEFYTVLALFLRSTWRR